MNIKTSEVFDDFIFDWNYKNYLLFGGYGSGKSYHAALKIILKLLTEKRTCLVVRNVFATLRESCYSLFEEICAKLETGAIEFQKAPMQVKFGNGSRIIFRGLDNPAKLKSINDVSLIWIEEATEITYDGFKELIGRLRHPRLKLHMILTTNPAAKSNWLYKHFFEKAGVSDAELYAARRLMTGETYYHHSTAADNYFLPKSYRETLNNIKSYDADLWRVAYLGQFGTPGTRVLPQFEIRPHGEVMAAVNKISPRFFRNGLDFGFEVSYNALAQVAVNMGEKILYIYGEYYKNHQIDIELAGAIKPLLNGALVKCDSASPKSIETLRRYGVNAVACRKWSEGQRRAVLANIQKIKRFHKIICSAECIHAVEELKNLVYATNKDGEIIEDTFNIDAHIFDAVVYALDDIDLLPAKRELSRGDLGI